MASYQSIIDVLVDAGGFEAIHFAYDTDLPDLYRRVALRKRNALQERPGKGRSLQKKWAHICAIKDGKVKVIVQEEKETPEPTIAKDIKTIAKCRYLWTDETSLPFDPNCVLFILLNNNVYGVQERTSRNVGNLKTVIVCDRETFHERYADYESSRGNWLGRAKIARILWHTRRE